MIKKINKKNKMCIAGCLLLMLTGGIFLCGCQKQETESAKSTESTEEVKLEKGQSFVYGQIVSINGNEMTYYVMEETEEKQEQTPDSTAKNESDDSAKKSKNSESERKERPQMPEGGFNGEMPEGFDGEMPWGDGEMPEGFGGGERPQMPWGDNGTDSVKEEETVTVQIPVGTKVTTGLGTETTFSRLAAGDNIKMLVQENDGQQEILEIWIVD